MNDNPVENYSYDSAGNLDVKNGLDLEYDDVNHVHAVTSAGVNTYSYDDNGNQTTRNVGGQTVQLGYDAENRLVSVTGTNLTAQFTYNGDGQRVKSVINTETVYFAGGHFEFNDTTDEVTKHYFAGASRIAVRKYIVPQSTTLNYLLGDHLGSTSIVTDAAGALVVETRYKPWGEVRYTTENLTLPTRYTFTGQYSYMDDSATDLGAAGFGLMFYNARWYDPLTGRFAQADSIVPGGLQGLDRYAYVNNSPVRYIDPSGHDSVCGHSYSDPECPPTYGGSPYADDLKRQDYLFSLVFPGSGPNGTWTAEDWQYYYEHRQELYADPESWINDDPEVTGWEQFLLHVARLASHYDLSDPTQQMQFVMDFGLLFAGIPSSNGFISGARDSMGGTPITYGTTVNGNPFPSYLHYSNQGLPEQYLDAREKENQTHHYAGIFYLSYFFGFGPANIINFLRDMDNSGDILLGWEAADDAILFSNSPEDLIVILTEW